MIVDGHVHISVHLRHSVSRRMVAIIFWYPK